MQDETKFEWARHVKECLDSTLLAILATRGNDSVWATPVYFSYDDDFNIYFISPRSTRHMQDIKEDARVSIAIITPASTSGTSQVGVQVEGEAVEVPDKEIEKVYKDRSIRMNQDSNWVPMPSEGHFVKEHGGVFMKVVPTSMNYINTNFFGGNSKKVPLAKLTGKK